MAVSRAVAPLKDLWKWSRPLLRNKPALRSFSEGGEQGTRDYKTGLQPGLICLKGGDLAKEIQESMTRPRVMEIRELFDETFFSEKYLLYVPK